MPASKLKLDIRRRKILEILKKESRVTVQDLSSRLNATSVTIRNDLDALEADGYLMRVQGGAVYLERDSSAFSGLSRDTVNHLSEKRRIGEAAASFIKNGDTLFINSGTTTHMVAEALKDHRNLNIVTNSLAVAMELSQVQSFRVILIGGELNPQYGFTYGGDAITQLSKFQADWAILSVDGVNITGFSTYHAEELMINKSMISQAKKTLFTADHSKIGHTGFAQICGLDTSVTLITDGECSEEALLPLKQTGLHVVTG